MESQKHLILIFLLASAFLMSYLSEFPALIGIALISYNVYAGFAGKRFILAGFTSGEEFAKSNGTVAAYRKTVINWCLITAAYGDAIILIDVFQS